MPFVNNPTNVLVRFTNKEATSYLPLLRCTSAEIQENTSSWSRLSKNCLQNLLEGIQWEFSQEQ